LSLLSRVFSRAAAAGSRCSLHRWRVTPIIVKIPMKNWSVAITVRDDLVNHSPEIQSPYGFDPTIAGLLSFSSGAATAIP
jgi:hypothetical protein